MIGKIISWTNIILAPFILGLFTYDLYHGNPATWIVWGWAYLGVVSVAADCAADLLEPTT